MSAMKTVEIPESILDLAHLSVDDVKVELAVTLYAQRRLGIGKARELAGMTLWEFRQILAARQIPAHYDVEDLEQDVETLRRLGDNQAWPEERRV